ncbi:MAG TPA: phage tail tube protein [Armatimonadota bacterium]|nr:phage tail tube protein [Armatimonadota bacterium]
MDSAKRVISGTWGALWIEGEQVAECYGFQAKYSFNKEDVPLCGQMSTDSKITSIKGTGSMRLHKVYSRAAVLIGDAIRNGKDLRFTAVSKLKDPDAYGAERVAVRGISFDDLTLADWEAKNVGKTEMPFTFTDHEFLDLIEPS